MIPPKPRLASRLPLQPCQTRKVGRKTYQSNRREIPLLLALLAWGIVGMDFMRCITDGGVVAVDIKVNIAAEVAAVAAIEVVTADIVVAGEDTAGTGVEEKVDTGVAGEADIGAIVAAPTTLDCRIRPTVLDCDEAAKDWSVIFRPCLGLFTGPRACDLRLVLMIFDHFFCRYNTRSDGGCYLEGCCQIFDVGWKSLKVPLDRIATEALHIATIITCMLRGAPAPFVQDATAQPVHMAVNFMHVFQIFARETAGMI